MLPIELSRRRRRRQGERCERAVVLLFETAAQRQIIAHACERARAAGIRPGMVLSAARAALHGDQIIIEAHDPRRAQRALRALALWCHRYSPTVAEEDAQGICLDVAGCTHLFGGEAKMIDVMRGALGRLGFASRIAIAPTFAAARAIARYGPAQSAIVDREQLYPALESLEVQALAIDEKTIAELAEVNITRLGHLISLPRAAVAARFGDAMLEALDRMCGRAAECIVPLRPLEPARVEQLFDGPCGSVEAIGLACRTLLDQLCALLAARHCGVVEWQVVLQRSDLDPLTLLLRHCAPSCDAMHLWRLLEPRLERAHLGFGVEGITIAARRSKPMPHRQRGWWGQSSKHESSSSPADVLTDTLVNRLGEEVVQRAELIQSHVPERAFAMRSVLDPFIAAAPVEGGAGDRPTCLFPAPVMARAVALTPDGPVSQVIWRGGTHRLVACIGPERLKGQWWEGQRLLRDYFKVQDEHGQWLWLYRDALHNQWFVHGMWV